MPALRAKIQCIHLAPHSDQTSFLGNSRNSGLYSSSMKSAAIDIQLPIAKCKSALTLK